jgi:hypothetical protein
MRRMGWLVLVSILLPAPLPAQAAKPAPTSLTIYNDGRVFARRVLPVAVSKGESTQRVHPGPLDPGSLLTLDPDVTILDARYDTVSSEQNALRRSVGRKFTFQTQSYPPVPIGATLVAVDPERWRLDDGTVLFQRPGLIRWPDDLVAFEPSLELRLRAAQSRPALGLGYFTAGAFWRASYQVLLGGADARVRGVAVITSTTLPVDSAEIQLLAGTIVQPQPLPLGEVVMSAAGARKAMAPPAPAEERVEESHVYTLAGRWSLRPGSTSLLPLFDESSAGVVREYVVRREPVYGIYQENEVVEEPPVQVVYTLARPRKTGFGDRPLPAGTARLFRADSDGRLQVVGEAMLEHTAPGKELVLWAGNAFDLSARRRQTEFVTFRDSSAAGVRMRAEAAYEVTVANATDSAVTVSVQEARAGEWSVLSSSVPGEKLSSTVTRFRVAVPPRGQTVLTYRIRAIW